MIINLHVSTQVVPIVKYLNLAGNPLLGQHSR